MGKELAAILALKKLAGFASEVNLRESTSHTPLPSANNPAQSGFETQKRHHQKSKTGESGPLHKKQVCPPKYLEEKVKMLL